MTASSPTNSAPDAPPRARLLRLLWPRRRGARAFVIALALGLLGLLLMVSGLLDFDPQLDRPEFARHSEEVLAREIKRLAAEQGGETEASGFGLRAKPARSEVAGSQPDGTPTLKPEARTLKPEDTPHLSEPSALSPQPVLAPLPFERSLGDHRFTVFGAVLGREIGIKGVGQARLFIERKEAAGGAVLYQTRLAIDVTDPALAILAVRHIELLGLARREGGRFEPRYYEHVIDYVLQRDERRRLEYHLADGYLVETHPARNKRVPVHEDCYDPVSVLLHLINRPFDDLLAQDADGDGRLDYCHIYIEGEEEVQVVMLDRAARRARIVFSDRAFPGGGTVVLAYDDEERGGRWFSLEPIALEYRQVVGGVLRRRDGGR